MKLIDHYRIMIIYFCGSGYISFQFYPDNKIMTIIAWSWFLLFFNNIIRLFLPNVTDYPEKKEENETQN